MVSISRVSRDGNSVILKSSTGYRIHSLNSSESTSGTFEALVASGSWRRPIEGDAEAFVSLVEIADGAIVASTTEAPKRPRLYRAPKNVREEISSALKEFSAIISDQDREVAKRISSGPVAKEDIEWMYTFFSQIDKAEKLRGGKYGKRWADKICSVKDPLTASVAAFAEDDMYFYGISDTEGSQLIQALLAIDSEQNVYDWNNNEWVLSAGENLADIDEPTILPLDGETAAKVATWINHNSRETPEGYDVFSADAVERNLFELAASEIDFEELDRVASIVADATGYSAPERSVNAKRQNRGPGGKFGGGGAGGGANPPSKTLTTFNKARLPQELPLVENVAERINEWLASAITAAAATTTDAMYFAIVDEVDKTAVMDAIAIRKSPDNIPEAYIRKAGEWVKDGDMLANLRGSTPPPVVELDSEETVKTVLAQIDEHDGDAPEEPLDDVSSSEQIQNLSVGFELADGSFPIKTVEDLENSLVVLSFMEPTSEEISHVRKRATALNRIDMVPSQWRPITTLERGLTAAAQSPLFGEFGEILAAGAPGIADTPGDFAAARRLQAYWTHGKGAAKIRWGTPGDLTRAHRHLAKYVGTGRAWGLAQNYHKSLFSVSNTTHDRATGQYKPRRRKR
jgi:hypothetical protein